MHDQPEQICILAQYCPVTATSLHDHELFYSWTILYSHTTFYYSYIHHFADEVSDNSLVCLNLSPGMWCLVDVMF